MFISKKHLDRRTFLRGMGATVALPLLDAMIPARTALAATAARPVPRLAFVYFPHGAIMDEWTPAAAGRDPARPDPRAAGAVPGSADDRQRPRESPCVRPGARDHARHVAVRRCRLASAAGELRVARGMTADQIAAQITSVATRRCRRSTSPRRNPEKIGAGAWEGDYGESYGTTISFRGSSTPLPMEFSPRRVFDTLFAPGATADERAMRAEVDERARSRRRRYRGFATSGSGLRIARVLRDYLDTVRDVERRVEQADALLRRRVAGGVDAFTERLALMFDMIALAFRADITRVASFMMAAETSPMTYDHLGVPDSFHLLSHHQNDPAKIEKLVRIQTLSHARVRGVRSQARGTARRRRLDPRSLADPVTAAT